MKVLIEKDTSEKLFWGADSFQGLPEHTDEDTRAEFANITLGEGLRGQASSQKGQFSASEEQFINTLVAHNVYKPQRIKLLKGWFKDTLPSAPIEKIAFLRLDGDIYASTRDAIESLYDRVSIGGFIYVDDYGSFLG
jgi:O-methyltransferase